MRYSTRYTYDIEPVEGDNAWVEITGGGTYWEQFPPWTSQAYRDEFEAAVQLYLDGQWPEAREALLGYAVPLPHAQMRGCMLIR